MNNKGKGNALFVLLIPIFIVVVIIIADTVMSYGQTKTYKELTEKIIKDVTNMDIEPSEFPKEIKRAYERYGYETDRLVVDVDDYRLYLENEHVYFGLLTSLGKRGEEVEFKLFNIEYLTFKLKKNSKTFIKVEVTEDENNELKFEYLK